MLLVFRSPGPFTEYLTRAFPLDHKTPPATRPGGLPIEVLAPSGARLPFYSGFPVQLGAAINIVDPLKVHDTAQLHDLALTSPWTPIAVTRSDAPGFPALLGAWRADPRLAGLVVLKAESITAPHSALHAALRAAGPPSAEEVAKWIHHRTMSERLGNTIFEELVDDGTSWRQTRYDRLKREGPLTAHGWQDVFRLTQALSHPDDSTIDAIAGAVDRCVRTLDRMPKRRMGMRLARARAAFGWRWAVEHILRLHGYMKESEPVALAPGLPSAEEVKQVWRHCNRRKALGA